MSTPIPGGSATLPATPVIPHPGITVRIRYVDRKGRETARFAPFHFGPANHPIGTGEWPPCECFRCGGRR